MGICDHDQIDDIQCKPLNRKNGIKNVVEKVDCNVDRGLVCNGKCSDYEIRVRCKCAKDNSKLMII